ncbi:hypothetical protein [Bradyrhizobium cenepequi]
MSLENVIGIDHAVIMVKDLDRAADNWIAADLTAAEKALDSAGVHSADTICVPPAADNGTLLAFVKT